MRALRRRVPGVPAASGHGADRRCRREVGGRWSTSPSLFASPCRTPGRSASTAGGWASPFAPPSTGRCALTSPRTPGLPPPRRPGTRISDVSRELIEPKGFDRKAANFSVQPTVHSRSYGRCRAGGVLAKKSLRKYAGEVGAPCHGRLTCAACHWGRSLWLPQRLSVATRGDRPTPVAVSSTRRECVRDSTMLTASPVRTRPESGATAR